MRALKRFVSKNRFKASSRTSFMKYVYLESDPIRSIYIINNSIITEAIAEYE